LTPPGQAALCVVRIVGPLVRTFLQTRLSRPVHEGRLRHAELRDDVGVIDDPVVLLGMDGCTAEISLHGGTAVIEMVLTLAAADGFEILESPLELPVTGCAGLHKPDRSVLELEVLHSLPLARTRLALQVLLSQPAAWKALVDSPWLPGQIEVITHDSFLKHLLVPPLVAIVGIPNAGKSTLANHLFGEKRSIVSSAEGTTRDWVGEQADIDGLLVKLIDTPGIRNTRDPIEAKAIAQSQQIIQTADLVIVVVDGSKTEHSQLNLIERYSNAVLVINHADHPLPAWSKVDAIRTVATEAVGMDALRQAIVGRFSKRSIDASGLIPYVWTSRQRRWIESNRVGQIVDEYPQ